ncbi:hypothetical protein IMSHALPRED_001022 [Imshaugia aleurites]|uniref:Zinc-binding loop region of homing endonuclease domain-containing protein n=1 Tax=Imshaugia aleurites TaxID=172621 RepID=A0A8H3PCX9_9LECA|nr:hypothetical protein IMSHALPRED_001022 [Imshaugia aleurites]
MTSFSGLKADSFISNGYYNKAQPDLKHMSREPSVDCSSDEGSDSRTRKITREPNTRPMTVEERKYFFIYTPTKGMKEATKKHFSRISQLVDKAGSNDDCRAHPEPPQCNGKAAGKFTSYFSWEDEYGDRQRLTVNWGIIALIVRQKLTDAQKDGFINHKWHLSHLCGNWTCCNWRHFTVESGPINVSRNGCFNSSSKCAHHPPCMKEKKRQLLVTDYIRRGISRAITSLGGILSYEAFHTLAEHDIRLVEWFWENSRRGTCASADAPNPEPTSVRV